MNKIIFILKFFIRFKIKKKFILKRGVIYIVWIKKKKKKEIKKVKNILFIIQDFSYSDDSFNFCFTCFEYHILS
jgi:hypothetical protein